MTYVITARKWRPQGFADVLGQEHVTRTLKNAIMKRHFAQSYLFSGPRGVGKTTMARIFAKALNCESGPTETPCSTCVFCKEVLDNNSMHYTEVDGASNRGIAEVRELNKSLRYASPQGKHRIFVIDEVHMLTTEAFNALLKTLEEPPEKVIFVFCTTEAHKVPGTIRSRCQHYAFKSFDIGTIERQLEVIVNADKLHYEVGSLFYIAEAAGGSMRDAQNILDQVVAYSEDYLSVKKTLEVLGKTDLKLLDEFIGSLRQQQLAKGKALLHALVGQGKNMTYFLYELVHCFSLMLYIRSGIEDLKLLRTNEEQFRFLKNHAEHFSQDELNLIGDLLFDGIRELKTTINEQVLLDLLLLRLHRYKTLITAEELKGELLALSKNLEKQDPPEELKEASTASNDDKSPDSKPKPFAESDYEKVLGSILETKDPGFEALRNLKYSKVEKGTLYLRQEGEGLKNDEIENAKSLFIKALQAKRYGTIREVEVVVSDKGNVERVMKHFKGGGQDPKKVD